MKITESPMICLGIAAALATSLTYADTSQDAEITSQVKSVIQRNADVGTEIAVSTKDGVVYLKGKTSTGLAKAHAEDLAKAIPGVQKVVNDLGIDK